MVDDFSRIIRIDHKRKDGLTSTETNLSR